MQSRRPEELIQSGKVTDDFSQYPQTRWEVTRYFLLPFSHIAPPPLQNSPRFFRYAPTHATKRTSPLTFTNPFHCEKHIPNSITSCNLICGCIAIHYAMSGALTMALLFIVLGAVLISSTASPRVYWVWPVPSARNLIRSPMLSPSE